MKLVLIEWDDACSYAIQGWLEKEDGDSSKMLSLPCVTVGILYQENDERVVVILNSNCHVFSQAQTIPKSCIKRMRRLKVSG